MKTKIVIAGVVVCLLSILTLIPEKSYALDVKFVGVEYYSGDAGKHNICDADHILVTEVYRLVSENLLGTKYVYQENGKIHDPYQVKYKRENGDITKDTCFPAGTNTSKTVWFVSNDGEHSNQLSNIIIDTTQSHLILEPKKWPLQVILK